MLKRNSEIMQCLSHVMIPEMVQCLSDLVKPEMSCKMVYYETAECGNCGFYYVTLSCCRSHDLSRDFLDLANVFWALVSHRPVTKE